MHNIEFYDFEENIHRDYVQRTLDAHVQRETYQEGGHGLNSPIRWLEKIPVCADRVEAEQMIHEQDKGWYDQLAVRYYEPKRGYTDKRLEELRAKKQKALEAYREKDSIWAKELKADFIGCRSCGSRLKREYVTSNRCPLCRADLRPASTLKAVEAAQLRWKKAEAAENSYRIDHSERTVRWLVKIEYHT